MNSRHTIALNTSILLLCLLVSSVEVRGADQPLLIRPFGDSITFGIGFNFMCPPAVGIDQFVCWPPSVAGGGYRGFMTLFSPMQDGIKFITEGYRSDGSYVLQWNTNTQTHDGYPGYTNTQLFPIAQKPSFANITLVHSGTNDILQRETAQKASENLSELLQYLLTANSSVELIVAQIIPLRPTYPQAATINEYNSKIVETVVPGIIQANSGRTVHIVDMYSVINTDTDMSGDGIHPNYNGYKKMACVWINKIKAVVPPPGKPCSPLHEKAGERMALPQEMTD